MKSPRPSGRILILAPFKTPSTYSAPAFLFFGSLSDKTGKIFAIALEMFSLGPRASSSIAAAEAPPPPALPAGPLAYFTSAKAAPLSSLLLLI